MQRKRVLVVDDHWDLLETLQMTLEPEFEVVAACGGEAALQSLEQERFDALVLDLAMPNIDGFDVMSFVSQRCPALPVVLASGEPDLAKIASEIGARDWVGKPYPPSAVRSKLRQLLDTRVDAEQA